MMSKIISWNLAIRKWTYMIDWVGQDGDWYENCTWGECADCIWPRMETQYTSRKYMCNVRHRLDSRQGVDLHSQRRQRSVELRCTQKTWREATVSSFLFVPLCETDFIGRIGPIEVECNCYNPTTQGGCNSQIFGPKETASDSRFFVDSFFLLLFFEYPINYRGPKRLSRTVPRFELMVDTLECLK